MKIKRPLINQYFEEADEPENRNEPLVPPTFTAIKPLEQAVEENHASEAQQAKEVVIQTRPSEEFLRKKAASEARAKQEALMAQKEEERIKKLEAEKERIRRENHNRVQEESLALPKTAVRAEEMPQIKPVVQVPVKDVISKDQLGFDIISQKPTVKQQVNFVKLYFERRHELLEISMLWKNPALPFAIVSLLVVSALTFIGGIIEFDRIPSRIPLFYNHVEKSWEQADKSAIFIVGIAIVTIEAILINLIIKIFASDRRLALTLSWVTTFINLLIVIAILQIHSLIT